MCIGIRQPAYQVPTAVYGPAIYVYVPTPHRWTPHGAISDQPVNPKQKADQQRRHIACKYNISLGLLCAQQFAL